MSRRAVNWMVPSYCRVAACRDCYRTDSRGGYRLVVTMLQSRPYVRMVRINNMVVMEIRLKFNSYFDIVIL